MTSVPAASLAGLLMMRHYLEGFLLACLASILYVAAIRASSRGAAVASATLPASAPRSPASARPAVNAGSATRAPSSCAGSWTAERR